MMVVVNIMDENDNNPDFNFVSGRTLNGTVPENSLSGTEVILETPVSYFPFLYIHFLYFLMFHRNIKIFSVSKTIVKFYIC